MDSCRGTWAGSHKPPRELFGIGKEHLSSRLLRANRFVAPVLQPLPQHAGVWVGWGPWDCQPAELRSTSPTEMPQGPT